METNKKLGIKIKIVENETNINPSVLLEIIYQDLSITRVTGKVFSYYCSETGMYVKSVRNVHLTDSCIYIKGRNDIIKFASIEFKTIKEAIEYKNDLIKTLQCFARDGYFGENKNIEQEEIFEF